MLAQTGIPAWHQRLCFSMVTCLLSTSPLHCPLPPASFLCQSAAFNGAVLQAHVIGLNQLNGQVINTT
jgi:hypothetical protein